MWLTKNSGSALGPQERSCRGAAKSLNTALRVMNKKSRAKLTEVAKIAKRHLMWVQGHSRSSNLSPSERAHATTLVIKVTSAVTRTVSELTATY